MVDLGPLDPFICLRCGGSVEWCGRHLRHRGRVADPHPVERSVYLSERKADR